MRHDLKNKKTHTHLCEITHQRHTCVCVCVRIYIYIYIYNTHTFVRSIVSFQVICIRICCIYSMTSDMSQVVCVYVCSVHTQVYIFIPYLQHDLCEYIHLSTYTIYVYHTLRATCTLQHCATHIVYIHSTYTFTSTYTIYVYHTLRATYTYI